MRHSSVSRPARRRASVWAAAFSAAALAIFGTPLTAQAATAPAAPKAAPKATAEAAPGAAAGTAPSTDRRTVEPACSAPGPGEFGCFALVRTDIEPVQRLVPKAKAASRGYGPAEIQDAYGLPSDGGAGQTVAIVDAFDDPAIEQELGVYREQFGMSSCTTANGCFRKVDQRGGTDYPAADDEWAAEMALDGAMVSAAAPSAHILLVEADSNAAIDLAAAADEAVALGAKYVSNSYGTHYGNVPGSGEFPEETMEYDAHYNHPGVAMVASSGDDGYGVSYPAASPYVTAVGGTSLTRDPDSADGWSESVWNNRGAPGSGCSAYEPKPPFQTDAGCGMRAVADVSAVADPDTGVLVYRAFGDPGWYVFGGTSAAAPIIAGTYAAAGTPDAGTYPNSYPYLNGGNGLYDVTSGDNGICTAAYLCTGGQGYDGPTGLGSPRGLTAFRNAPHGRISGAVADAATGAPLAGAAVAVGASTVHTGADGHYAVVLPVGTYDITVDAYGRDTAHATRVRLAEGDSLTRDFTLATTPTRKVSGKITDGSGHHWPLYAKVTVDGVPGGPVFTDPSTGAYSIELPQGHSYRLRVTSAYSGYRPADRTFTLGAAASTQNIQVPIDPWAGTAPGYTAKVTGPTEPFDSTTSPPSGWIVTDAQGSIGGWEFDDPGQRGNTTGGTGAFAVADSDHYGGDAQQDSSLISPVYDFTGQALPELGFQTTFHAGPDQEATIDVSTDDGAHWKTVWSAGQEIPADRIDVPLEDYADAPHVQVRFHYTGSYGLWWAIDDVQVADRSMVKVPGGLVVGTVTDTNTGQAVAGAAVDGTGSPAPHTLTASTPDDPRLADGFYWTFAKAGKSTFTASRPRYTDASSTVKVGADATTRAAFALRTGRLSVTDGTISTSVSPGGKTTRTLKVKNTGSAPVTVNVSERPAGSGPAAPGGDSWQSVANFPMPIADNAVDSYDGKLYSAYGYDGAHDVKILHRYDPQVGSWTSLTPPGVTRESPAHGFIGGKLYVAGGRTTGGGAEATLEIYDPAHDSWSTGRPAPQPVYNAGSAVLGGKLYTVGGCPDEGFCGLTAVNVYDPATDSWSTAADYPHTVSYESCGAVEGKLYCAGGTTEEGYSRTAHVYDPAENTWSRVADLPLPLWGSSTASANGLLMVWSGKDGGSYTSEGFAYDPQTDAWSVLPETDRISFGGGGAPGFYSVGGFTARSTLTSSVSLLPGYDQPDGVDVSWLSESRHRLTIEPGRSQNITVAMDSSLTHAEQPAVFRAMLVLSSEIPYPRTTIPVAMTVTRPAGRGGITGTVRGRTGAGAAVPLAGATVHIESRTCGHTLRTSESGGYELWLDAGDGPLTVRVGAAGYKPAVVTVRLRKGAVVVSDVTLRKA